MDRTEVAIVGGGPAGLLLSHLLGLDGIDSVVLERRPRAHVLGRIRAGVLEAGSVALLREAGLGARLDAQGQVHHGFEIAWRDARLRIDLNGLTARSVTVYGQTEVTRDLYAAADARGARVLHGAEVLAIEGIETDAPEVVYREARPDGAPGPARRLAARIVAGCDGFHGASRAALPGAVRRTFERAYPFGWLGLLARTRPVAPELIYAAHPRGFALASMRSDSVSRYYLQVPVGTPVEDWPPARFWEELARRLPAEVARDLDTAGAVLEMSVAPLRSFVVEPMAHGALLLAGDAAHIVPPTGAKGLNLAIADVRALHRAAVLALRHGQPDALAGYSAQALARVWRVERFSWWMTTMLHDIPDLGPFERRMQRAEFETLRASETARKALAESYVGLPY